MRIAGWHFLGWVLFFGTVILFISSEQPNGFRLPLFDWPFLLFAAVYLFLFYINTYLLLPKLYFQKKYIAYFSIAFLLFATVFFLQPFDQLVGLQAKEARSQIPELPRWTSVESPLGPMPFPPDGADRPRLNERPPGPSTQPPSGRLGRQRLDIVSVVLFMAVWSAGSVLQMFRQWRISERRAARAEADKVTAELSFLKAQINPHFLFNTLNNIYSLATVKSEHTPSAIMKLSHILRYITDDVSADLVPLQLEVDCATNYIALQELRISKKVQLDFSVVGSLEEKKVAPLVFMTFIENAFKYGVSNREECTITIRISAEEKKVTFFCRNKIIRTDDEDSTGVGINNARKRLAYLYPEKHLLLIEEDDHFTVDLTITA